jgi:hypothetical protein
MIVIFLCLNFSESSSQGFPRPLSLLNIESLSQTNLNTSDYNLDIKIGFSFDVFENTKWNYVLIEKLDFLQLGYNYDGIDDFFSFNFLKLEKLDSWKEWEDNKEFNMHYYSQSLDLISINRDCINQKETNWIKLGLGRAYDFFKNYDDILLAEGLMKVGYTNLELNNNVGKLLNSNTALNFEGIEIELGTRVQYIDESFKIIIVSNFKKLFDKMDMNILENGVEIIYSFKFYSGHTAPVPFPPGVSMNATTIVPVFEEILNFTLFGNYNLYSTNNTTIAIPIVGLKLKVYANLFADR